MNLSTNWHNNQMADCKWIGMAGPEPAFFCPHSDLRAILLYARLYLRAKGGL